MFMMWSRAGNTSDVVDVLIVTLALCQRVPEGRERRTHQIINRLIALGPHTAAAFMFQAV